MKKFEYFLQLDQMDCGPTCLQMVAKHYGRHFQLSYLRRNSFITHEGVSLLGISDAAESIGFRTIGVKTSFKNLIEEAPLPCIVHWRQQHFIVVYKITSKSVYVADPAVGLIDYSYEEFKKGWLSIKNNGQELGIALLLEPTSKFFEPDDEDRKEKSNLNFLWNYIKPHNKLFLQLAIGFLTISLIQLILPFLTQSIVDVGINTQNVQFIYLVLLGQMMLFIGRTSVDFIRRWILLHLSTKINISLVSDFLLKLFKLPMSFFESKMIGDILRRIEDHSRIERFISTSSLSILFSFFNLFVFGIVLAIYNVSIFLVFSALSFLYVVYVQLFMNKRAKLDYKRFQQLAVNQSSLIETVEGMAEIKISNSETQSRWTWESTQAKLYKVNFAGLRLQQFQDGGSTFLNETKNMLITIMAALAVIKGEMTMGMMLSVQYIIGQLNVPLNDFLNFIRDWQDARISLERINEVHRHENENVNATNHLMTSLEGSIIVDNASFQYEGPRSPKVLNEIDLIVPHGKVTAIVGSSGSGKTTLMKLLLKFYDPIEGKITVAGENLKYIDPGLWRSRCGTVMQDGFIFSDTIARNIALGEEIIDQKRLIQAVRVANIDTFIDSLPLRYNTIIGKSGVGVSQGQKQRILIARAVYKNPEIIFFDEATSALDANNEKKIMQNLDEFFKGKTVVVIAHRLSTVKNADQIVVLEQGEIVEVGTHYDLTQSKGKYFELVRNQLELGN